MVTPEPTKPRGGKKRSASEAFGLRQSLVDLAAGRKQDAAQISVGPQDQTRTKEHNELRKIVDDTVRFGHGNSVVLVGPRGAGKSMLVKQVLADLETTSSDRKFAAVRLNGLVHSDDKIALREIMRQLMLDQEMENASFGSFAEAFECLLGALKRGSTESLPIVILLDEFETFAQQPRQTLLYNLFDAAQSGKNPVLVIGLATQIDLLESLEKRVKSRFSHRFLHVLPSADLDDFVEKGISVESTATDADAKDYLRSILTHKESGAVVRSLHEVSNNTRSLHMALAYAVDETSSRDSSEIAIRLRSTLRSQAGDAKALLLKDLHELGGQLISAISRVRERSSVVNFAMVYNEYREGLRKTNAAGGSLQRKGFVKNAFELLIQYELLKPVSETSKGGREHEMYRVMLPLDV